MAGLNIGAPARLQRSGRTIQPAGASTLLGGGSGELPRTYFSSSARVDYRWWLELNTQDSDQDVLFRQEMRYPEGRRLLQPQASWCRGEQGLSACATAGGVRISDGVRVAAGGVRISDGVRVGL
jgi:hypothetical protein